jgi:hypothetical protein
VDDPLSWKRGVRDDNGLAAGTQELNVKKLQKSCVSEQRPPHRHGSETYNRVPSTGLKPVGKEEGYRRVIDVDDGAADQPDLARGGGGGVEAQALGQVGGKTVSSAPESMQPSTGGNVSGPTM